MTKYLDKLTVSFQDELQKIAHAKLANAMDKSKAGVGRSRIGKALAVAGAGAAAYEGARRANEDRRMGRQFRLQNSPGIFG